MNIKTSGYSEPNQFRFLPEFNAKTFELAKVFFSKAYPVVYNKSEIDGYVLDTIKDTKLAQRMIAGDKYGSENAGYTQVYKKEEKTIYLVSFFPENCFWNNPENLAFKWKSCHDILVLLHEIGHVVDFHANKRSLSLDNCVLNSEIEAHKFVLLFLLNQNDLFRKNARQYLCMTYIRNWIMPMWNCDAHETYRLAAEEIIGMELFCTALRFSFDGK